MVLRHMVYVIPLNGFMKICSIKASTRVVGFGWIKHLLGFVCVITRRIYYNVLLQ